MSDPLSEDRICAFLEYLAETSNVSKSASRAGLTRSQVYRLRATNAVFRQGWLDAIGAGYADLELEMLWRARFGIKKPYKRADGKQGRQTEFDDAQSLKMLMAYKAGLNRGQPGVADGAFGDVGGARDRLLAKLDVIRARLDAVEAGSLAADARQA